MNLTAYPVHLAYLADAFQSLVALPEPHTSLQNGITRLAARYRHEPFALRFFFFGQGSSYDEAELSSLINRGYGLARQILGDNGDVGEPVFMALLDIGRLSHEPENLDAYFLRAVRNRSYDILRRKKRWNTISIDKDGSFHPELVTDHTPREHAQLRDIRIGIAAAIERLSPNHRSVVIYRHLEGMAHSEIASRLGISEGTVRSRLSRANAVLRGDLTEFTDR